MAARAMGFRGFGRENLSDAQRESIPELVPQSAEAREAELILRGGEDFIPIWRASMNNGYGRAFLSEEPVEFSPDGKWLMTTIAYTNVAWYDTTLRQEH